MQEVRRLTIINDTSLSFLKDYIWHRKASWKTPPRAQGIFEAWPHSLLRQSSLRNLFFDWFTSKMISIDLCSTCLNSNVALLQKVRSSYYIFCRTHRLPPPRCIICCCKKHVFGHVLLSTFSGLMNNNVPKKLCQQQTCSAVVVNLSTRCFSAVMHRNCFSVLLSWLTAHFYLKLSSSQHSAIKLCQQTKVIRYWVVNLSANNGQGVAITLQAQFSADVCVGPFISISARQLIDFLQMFHCQFVSWWVKNYPESGRLRS